MSVAPWDWRFWTVAVGLSLFFSFVPRRLPRGLLGLEETSERAPITPWYLRFASMFSGFLTVLFATLWDGAHSLKPLFGALAGICFVAMFYFFYWMRYAAAKRQP